MTTKKDISTLEDIKILVNSFYSKIQKDEILGPIFEDKIQGNWDKHLDKMYRFWQTILLEEHTYTGSPFPPHAQLPINKSHFDLWLYYFSETLNEHFSGKKSDEAYNRAQKMAQLFAIKIESDSLI